MRKLFSLIAAVLFAGSMMATDVVFSGGDFTGGTANTGSAFSVTKNNVTVSSDKAYGTGSELRIYQGGVLTVTSSDGNIATITPEFGTNTKMTFDAASPNATSWSINATKQIRLSSLTVTLGEGGGVTPPDPVDPGVTTVSCAAVYSMAKNDAVELNDVVVTYVNGKNVWVKDATASMLLYLPAATDQWAPGHILSGVAGTVDIYNGLYEVKPTADQVSAVTIGAGEVPAPEVLTAAITTADMNKYIKLQGIAVEGTFTEGTASNIAIANGEGTIVLRNNFKNGYTFEAGKTYDVTAVVSIYQNNPQLYFISAEEAGGTTPVNPETPTDPTTCAEAAAAALSVENNNDLYNDGAVYSITGYVTAIQTAYNSQYNNISFWMADAANGGNVLEAYRAACASAEDAPIVGDKVTVTGSLTKYNTTPEFAAGCTYVIVEHATPAVPQNLGEKTIAEFLALANTVDTCVITGVVANIVMDKNDATQYNKYGNFDLVDGEASVYVYGLLTADGQAQQFQSMGVDEGDTLTVKAVYSLYNNKVQAKNAVFVEVKKAVVTPIVPSDTVDITITSGLVFDDYVASQGWWQIYGGDENTSVSISNIETEQVNGTYTIDDLDMDWTYLKLYNDEGELQDSISFVSGEVTVVYNPATGAVVSGTLVGNDGKAYNFNLVYVIPTVEAEVTIAVEEWTLYDDYLADYGLFAIYANGTNGEYLQFALWTENDVAGDYTEADLDDEYVGCNLEVNGEDQSIYSATIHVAYDEATQTVAATADVLCYNNTLYHIRMQYPTAIEQTVAAGKAAKVLRDGKITIIKGNKTFNMNGALVR